MDNVKKKLYDDIRSEDENLANGKPLLRHRPIFLISELSFSPPTDVWETENEIRVLMEIGKLHKTDLKIGYSEGNLIIAGERPEPEFPEAEKPLRIHKKEIDYGPFSIKIKMNTRILADSIRADYQNGFLAIRLGKDSSGSESADKYIPVNIE
ncbi:MAG: Hsp20/alpha crystallin family protein [Calditrichia bacterium]